MELKRGQLKITVWEDDICDDYLSIIDSNGFSLDLLNEIKSEWEESRNFEGYKGLDLIVEPDYVPEQRGNYEPPNIESHAYWDYLVVCEL